MGLKDSREIYDLMKERAKIIEKLIENNIIDYFEVVKMLKKYYKEGREAFSFSI